MAHNLLKNSLFYCNKDKFEQVQLESLNFRVNYIGNNIIQDDIFQAAVNYAGKSGETLRILKLPVNDDELCAFFELREDMTFMVVNSSIPLCKQIFAAAHELYHIKTFIDGTCEKEIDGRDIYTASIMNEGSTSDEEKKANAFAAVLLAPRDSIFEQRMIYHTDGMSRISEIITLMNVFAIPYNAMVLRLYETSIIGESEAEDLLTHSEGEIAQIMESNGISTRWEERGKNYIDLDGLDALMRENQTSGDVYPEERIAEDMEEVNRIRKFFAGG